MSYQNIFFEKESSTIHCWDSVKGYYTKKYKNYAYIKDGNGSYKSIYGDRLKRITYWDRDDTSLQLFESDVSPELRFLIDEYGNDDSVSDNHTVFTYDIEVEMRSGLPDVNIADNIITSIAGYDTKTKEYFVFVLSDTSIDKTIDGVIVKSFSSERSLLSSFLERWVMINPTIITGWNIDWFDTTYLYNRMVKVIGASNANQLSPIGIVKWNDRRNRYFIAGVSSLDYIALYKNFTYTELPNYRLDTIAKLELGRGKVEYDGNLDQLFRDDLLKFIKYNLVDVELVVALDEKLKFISLAQAVCHAGHVPYENFLFSSMWLEGAILTFLRRNGKVSSNKPKRTKSFGDKEDKFAGAYVKQPTPGLYKWIYDLDLTSLYPSIIMSLNISPETKRGYVIGYTAEDHIKGLIEEYVVVSTNGETFPPLNKDEFIRFLEGENYSISSNGILYTKDFVGVIPEILSVWFDRRVEFKNLMKKYGKDGDDEKYKFYHQRQLVQKIMLNSLYGYLGLVGSRFYDIQNAEAVTLTGRTVIQTTEMITNKYYTQHIGEMYDITIETGEVIRLGGNVVVELTDGSKKRVSELTETDDINL